MISILKYLGGRLQLCAVYFEMYQNIGWINAQGEGWIERWICNEEYRKAGMVELDGGYLRNYFYLAVCLKFFMLNDWGEMAE